MKIDIKGRNVTVTPDYRERIERHFRKVEKMIVKPALLEVTLDEERNPSIAKSQIAEATLYLKGAKLHARVCDYEMPHAISKCSEEIVRQLEKQRGKRKRFWHKQPLAGGAEAAA